MKLSQKIESKIKTQALKLLANGRTGWDKRHTLCAVGWMRKLIEAEGGDERVLIPAIYFHDTGYEELAKDYGYDEVIAAKPGHAELGAIHAKKFLPKLKYFTTEENDRIVYLIANHDKHNNITEHDRQMVFEADGLAQIDWYNCPPSFDKENCQKFLDGYLKTERIPYLKLKYGKKVYKELLKKNGKIFKRDKTIVIKFIKL